VCAEGVSIPPMPAEFYGTVSIGNNPAPVGTTVTALLNGVRVDELITTEAGVFGGGGIFDKRLSVIAEETNSGAQTIQFLVNGISAERGEAFAPGTSKQIELLVPDANAKESISSPTTTITTVPPTIIKTTIPTLVIPTLVEVQTIPTDDPFIFHDYGSYYPPNLEGYPEFQNERVFTSGDERAQLISYPGSEIKTAAGSTVQLATIKRKSLSGISTPDGTTYAGYGYELVPAGLSFLPDATFVVSLDDGLFESNPMIMRYEAGTGAWMYMPSFADRVTGTVRAAVTESGIYGVVIQDMTPIEEKIETPIPTQQTPVQPVQTEQIMTQAPVVTTVPTVQMVTSMQTELPRPPAQGSLPTPQPQTIWYIAGGIFFIILLNIMVWRLYLYVRR
jgi:hypothetical protein